jgi:vacuolar-type H+-ATPase subunit H
MWQEMTIQFKDFSKSFNKVNTDLEYGYQEEINELKKRLLQEFNSICNENTKQKSSLNANQVMNAVYKADIFFRNLDFKISL